MRWLKRCLWLLLALGLTGAMALGIYVYRAFPALDGQLRAAGLRAPVTVSRDRSDVTHIEAQNPHDAWLAMGYVHAQERGWQLEFNRRVMHGELSEVLGEATVETDKLLRTLGIMRAAQRQWDSLPAEGKDAMQAYSDGINAFYASHGQALPPEFHILGTRPGGVSGKAWTPQDSIGWSLMMALDLGGNWGTEFARLSASQVLDNKRLWQLFPPYPGEAPASKTDLPGLYAQLAVYRSSPVTATKTIAGRARPVWLAGLLGTQNEPVLARQLAADVKLWAETLGSPEGRGSNSWVVAGSRTQSGKPLLANDPHLGLSAPAIWYFAHLKAPGTDAMPALDAMGATLPGLPFVVLGRTRQAAWTFTNTNPDVQDLYLEQVNPANPAQYRVPAEGDAPVWADFTTRPETIRVKGRADVVIAVRESRHGPVLSDAQKSHGELLDTGKYVIALRWAALDADNQTVLAGLRANRAQSTDEMLKAFEAYHSPMQSLVVADTQGNTAFKAVGKVPLRRADNDILGVAPSPGWEARYDWAGWLPYAQTPQAGNADIAREGWLATANQRITPPGYASFIGQDWTVPYRYDRIAELLQARPQHDMASMQLIQGDQFSPATAKLLPFLQKTLAGAPASHALAGQAREALAGFDGDMQAVSPAPLIFAAWADELARGIIGGKLGEARFKSLYGKRHFRATVEDVMDRNDTAWCGKSGCHTHSTAALQRALDRLQALYGSQVSRWHWGLAHQAVSGHRPFGNVALLAPFFNVAVPTGGDTFTINAGQYWTTDDKAPFINRQAASMRAVYDLSNLDNSLFIYQTGQSGLVFSPRYRDMSEGWAGVQYRPLQMNPPGFDHQLVLKP